MKEEIIIAGFGGQGVLSMGKILAYCAIMQPPSLLRMVAGGIEKMVAQHTEEHPAGEVHVEGFYVYGMCVYLVHLSISRCVRYWSSRSTRLLVTAIRPERTN